MPHNEQVQSDEELLKLKQVASELQVDIRTVYRYIRQKKLRVVRLSAREFRIWRSELKRFLQERETGKDTN
ncbi:MAG TPA: helix-turn-helix domain-containing protein [Ktedonobacteraceae bacterium]|nr:helix-turn-helix domain-containing protein [Ktedonobacteraceae bacterium]